MLYLQLTAPWKIEIGGSRPRENTWKKLKMENNMPQPIETAPKDGTVILTECGFVLYIDQKNWGSPVRNGWACCTPREEIFDCADNGNYYCEPKFWEPVPQWITKCS